MMKYEMQYAGPKRRVRRDWRGTVLTGLTLLTMAALVAWLWSCVAGCWMLDAGYWNLATSNEPLVAMAPWAEGSLMGLVLFFSVVLILLAVRKVEENERWFEGLRQRELERRQRIEKAARFWDEKTGEEKGWEDEEQTVRGERAEVRGEELSWRVGPLESLSEPLAADEGIRAPLSEVDMLTVRSERSEVRGVELRRIVEALVVETCSARDDVRKAQGDLSVEDYGAKLAAAEASLHLVIGCLGGLIERIEDEGAMMKNEEVRP